MTERQHKEILRLQAAMRAEAWRLDAVGWRPGTAQKPGVFRNGPVYDAAVAKYMERATVLGTRLLALVGARSEGEPT